MQPPSAPLEIPPTNVVPLGYLQANGVIYELDDAETQIGRADSNDIVLKGSRSISGSHARIVIHPTKLRTARLVDLGSLNGCFVNDDRVHNASADLHSGDVIRFGYDKDVYIFHFPQDIPASILGETLLSPGAAGTGGAGTRTHSLSQRIPQPPSSRSPSEARMPQESASPGSSAFGAAPRLRGSARNAHQLTPAPQVERDRAGPLAYSEHTNEAERVRMVQSVNRNSVESDNASSPPSYVLADSLALSATPSRPPIIAQPISFSASMGDRSQGGVVSAHVPSVSALNQSQLGDISGSVEPLGVYIASPPFHSPAPGSSSDEVSGSYEGVVRAEAAHVGESASAHTAGTTHGGRRRAAAAGAMNSTFGAGTGVDDVYGAVASQFAPIASVSIPTVTLESGEIRARDSSAGTARSFTASATGGHRYSGTTSSARRSTSTPPSAASSTLPPSRTGSHVPSSNAVTPGLLHVQQHGDSTGELPAAATAGAAAADSAVSPEAVHSLLSGMQQDRQTLVTVMQGVNDLLMRLNASQGGGGRTTTLTTLSPSPLQTSALVSSRSPSSSVAATGEAGANEAPSAHERVHADKSRPLALKSVSLALQRPYLRRLREAMQQWRRVCVAEAARDARGGSVQQVSDDVLIIRSPHTSRPQTPLTAHISGYGSAMPSRAVSPLASFIDAITDDARNVFGRKGERVPGSDEASPPSKPASQPVMEQLAQPAHTLQHKPGSLARMSTAPPAITAPGVRGYDTSAIDAQAVTGVLPSIEGTRSFLAGDLNTSDASGDTERARCLAAPPPPENVHAGAAASTAASRARSRSPTHLGVDEFFRRSLRPSTQSGAPEASLHMTTGFASQAGLGLGMSTMRSSSAGRARSVSTEPARSERAGRHVGRAASASARTSSPRATVRSLVPTQPITAMLSPPVNVERTLSAALCSPPAGVELSASTRASGMSTRATAAVPSSTHPFDSRTAQAGVPAELRAHQRSSPHRESAQELAVRAMMQSREEALRRMVGTADDAIIALAHIATNTPLVPPSDGGLMDAVPSLAQQSAPPRELDGSSALQRQREAGPARVQHAERAVLDGSSPRASNTMQQERSVTGRSRRSDARAGAHEAKQAGGAKEPAEQRLSPIPAPPAPAPTLHSSRVNAHTTTSSCTPSVQLTPLQQLWQDAVAEHVAAGGRLESGSDAIMPLPRWSTRAAHSATAAGVHQPLALLSLSTVAPRAAFSGMAGVPRALGALSTGALVPRPPLIAPTPTFPAPHHQCVGTQAFSATSHGVYAPYAFQESALAQLQAELTRM